MVVQNLHFIKSNGHLEMMSFDVIKKIEFFIIQ